MLTCISCNFVNPPIVNMRTGLERLFHSLWYGSTGWHYLLVPVSWLYCATVRLRRSLYNSGFLHSSKVDCRTVVVGNPVVGGGGKTPTVIALSRMLTHAGLRVGILCRGYRGRATEWPQSVTPASLPDLVGDEAVLLAGRTGLPVMAGPDRVAAANALLARHPCDVLICDDGLQHYALQRDIEIAVVDATYAYGNRYCLPAGPLREPVSRLDAVDAVVAVGAALPGCSTVAPRVLGMAVNLSDPCLTRKLAEFCGQRVYAVAGIAHPGNFFHGLRSAGLELSTYGFGDHYAFAAPDLEFAGQTPVLMTEKDAVKCQLFAQPNWWCVPMELDFDNEFEDWLLKTVKLE